MVWFRDGTTTKPDGSIEIDITNDHTETSITIYSNSGKHKDCREVEKAAEAVLMALNTKPHTYSLSQSDINKGLCVNPDPLTNKPV